MPRLSIIIPLLDGAPQFEDTLVSVLQNRPARCEVLVVHPGPYGDPYELAGEVRFIEQPAAASRAQLLNAGLEAAKSELVHVLAAGVTVDEGWTESVWEHFQDPQVAAVCPLVVQAENPQRIASAGLGYGRGGTRRVRSVGKRIVGRRAVQGRTLGPTLQAAFYRRELLQVMGGFSSDVGDELADVDLALTCQALGYRAIYEPACRMAIRTEKKLGSAGFTAGRQAERLFWRHAAHQGLGTALALHPLSIAGAFVRQLPRPAALMHLLGRAVGCCEVSGYRRHQRRLHELKENCSLEPEATRLPMPQPKQASPVSERRAA